MHPSTKTAPSSSIVDSTSSNASSIESKSSKSVSANSSSVKVIVYSTITSTDLSSTIVMLIISTEPSGKLSCVSRRSSKLLSKVSKSSSSDSSTDVVNSDSI